ncbi:MAG TPA: nucleotidyl transferase AbiEii/AbiGii toxin family protein [Ignavibacteria bacterium]|nr:nucleotidyl transferase AbiEii/AbiGii toxin family protein [Ignavibacteria bacterium]HMR41538.1 nucleotidyl transferase AbiEii/AbiGii toxin family protein [Ignavibacteria bacterium]
MITTGEVDKTAARLVLRPGQIEKDYILGWILKGISENKFLKEKLIFKGGTAIRKIYVQDYRLSEDLDFTYIDECLDDSEIKKQFELVCEWIKNESRIELSIENENINVHGNYSFYLEYKGPLGGTKNSVKVDVSCDEKICDATEEMEIKNEYSDLTESFTIKSYTLNEIISEKMRSLMQRTAPRDLYDLWYFFEIENKDIIDFIPTFKEKAEYENIKSGDFANVLSNKKNKLKIAWSNQLNNQIKDVPEFEEVWRTLNKHLRKFDKNI